MKPKAIAIVVAFAALTIVLTTTLVIPFPPLQTFFFGLGEIPIIILFLLFGFRYALLAAVIDCVFMFTVFPGPSSPFVPLGAIVAWSSMMLGIFLVNRNKPLKIGIKRVAYAIGSAIACRVLLTMPLMYGVLKLPIFNIPDLAILLVVFPLLAVFNTIQALITLPASFLITNRLDKTFKMYS
jgi:riboflavin transporter FmnP